ncbi:MAG: 1,4-dihydroxy-2-naphthoate polyprenyltransferase [Phocaeicola sp.]
MIIKPNSIQAWLLATRPKTLTGAATPVLLGAALAMAQAQFQLVPTLLCFLFAGLMQIDANLINDLFDYVKGADREDRLGPERACAQGWITIEAMKRAIALTTMLACATGVMLLFYGGLELIPIGILCILFAFLYTAGPYPLAYHGWGDLLVWVFFGIVPVGGTYYVMCHDWSWTVTLVALACGWVIDTLLMVNNYRDREQDATSGKRTLVVRWGAKTGGLLYLGLGVGASLICFSLALQGLLWAALLPQFYLILHYATWRKMIQIGSGKKLNSILGETSRNMLIWGVLLSIGLVLSALYN